MAFSNVALFGGSFLTPVVAGKIAATMSWQWTFYFVAIFTGAALPLTFFLVPETAFRRPDYLNTDFKEMMSVVVLNRLSLTGMTAPTIHRWITQSLLNAKRRKQGQVLLKDREKNSTEQKEWYRHETRT